MRLSPTVTRGLLLFGKFFGSFMPSSIESTCPHNHPEPSKRCIVQSSGNHVFITDETHAGTGKHSCELISQNSWQMEALSAGNSGSTETLNEGRSTERYLMHAAAVSLMLRAATPAPTDLASKLHQGNKTLNKGDSFGQLE